MDIIINNVIRGNTDTAANWLADTDVRGVGFIAFSTDEKYNFGNKTQMKFKVYDGTNDWENLDYIFDYPLVYDNDKSNYGYGAHTFENVVNGRYNNAHGDYALINLRNGSNNVAMGDTAGYNLRDGNGNVFIGHDSYVDPREIGAGYVDISFSIALGGGTRVTNNNQFVVGGNAPSEGIKNTFIGNGVMNTATQLVDTTLQTTGVNIGDANGSAAGSVFRIAGAKGTGTGDGGAVVIATAKAGVSGSAQNALVDFFYFNQDQTITYIDGNQGAGKILTSDGNGKATWQAAIGGEQDFESVMTNGNTYSGVWYSSDFLGSITNNGTSIVSSLTDATTFLNRVTQDNVSVSLLHVGESNVPKVITLNDTQISFDSPVYNFTNITPDSYAYFDSSNNLVSGAIPVSSLSAVLTAGNSTGDKSILSPDTYSYAYIRDVGWQLGRNNLGGSSSYISGSDSQVVLGYTNSAPVYQGYILINDSNTAITHSDAINITSPVTTFGGRVYLGVDAVDPFEAVTFKQMTAAGYLTTISGIAAGGDLSGTYTDPTVKNSAVIGKVLTGLNVAGASISATDTIVIAFGKLQSQINGVLGGAIYQGVYNAATNTPVLADGAGVKGNYYVVNVDGIRNLGSGSIDFKVGDWAIYNGAVWQKVDNTDAVSDVNGAIGSVSLGGAANRITVSGNIWDIAANYVGQASITTLGIITSGAWNGSVIGGSYGGTGVNNGANTLTFDGATSLTGGGAVVLGGFTATVPATGTITLGSPGAAGRIFVGTSTTTGIGSTALTYTSNNLLNTFSVNGIISTQVINANAGGSTQSQIMASNNTEATTISVLGTGFTTSGLNVAHLSKFVSTSSVGVLFQNATAATKYWWTIGGVATTDEVMRLTQTGLGVLTQADPTKAVTIKGDILMNTAGNGLYIKEGSNATMGVATLVAGTVTVNTTKVTANSRIYLTVQSLGTVAVATAIAITARVAATSFTIRSSSVTDTSVVAWVIVEPG